MKAIKAVICFLFAMFSVFTASGKTENNGELEIQVTNQSKVVQVLRASTMQKDGYTLVSFRTKLRNYTLMPTGSHVHVELYNKKGELIEQYIQKLRKSQFRHTVTGRHRPSNSNKRVYVAKADIGMLKIHAFTESHDKHS
jgi:hypothetical protein